MTTSPASPDLDPYLDREYNARASVPSFDAEYARYVEASIRAKQHHPPIAELIYDAQSGETLDLYPAAPGAPLFLWIHGGYWRASSKDDNAFVVPGLLPHGFAVAVMNYSLAPKASLDDIVRQTRAAVAWLHRHGHRHGVDARRIHIGGSSAGGHLVGMLLAQGWTERFDLPDNVIASALALSGLFDVEPLRRTHVNAWMHLDADMATRNSPIHLIPPHSDVRLIASVGGLETAEFQRQTAAYTDVWRAAGHACETVAMPEHNHYDIALSLGDPDGALARAVARLALASN